MLDNGQAWLTTNKRDRDLLNTDADNVAKYMCSYTPQPVLLQPAMAPVSQELRAEEEAVSQLRVQVRMAEEAAALSWPGLQLQPLCHHPQQRTPLVQRTASQNARECSRPRSTISWPCCTAA